jgi:hypothetical protein
LARPWGQAAGGGAPLPTVPIANRSGWLHVVGAAGGPSCAVEW